ncbi:MAG: amylo-alpha-1,6-glucosidase [Candidatus Aminicenantes bacterium]
MDRLKKFLVFLFVISFVLPAAKTEVYYPWKDVYMGALEARAWAGLVLAPHPHSVFAFRLRIKKGGEVADGSDLFFLIAEVGPHAPDGQYARVKMDLSLPFNRGPETPVLIKPPSKSDTLVVEWSRQDEKTILGRVKAPKGIEIHLVHYFPWDFQGEYILLPDRQVAGESTASKKYHYLLWTSRRGGTVSGFDDQAQEELALSFSTEEEKKLYFVAGVEEDARILRNHIYRYKNEKVIDSILKEEEKRYEKKRVKIDNLYEGAAKAITNNIFWMTLYQPGKHRLYIPAGRRWIFPQENGRPDHWTIFEWDSFFNALEVSIESPKHAKDIIKAVLDTQYPNGNIPNWRGRYGGAPDRSQPPVGSYVVLKLFQKFGDLELLKYAYPYLRSWHSFWKAKKDNGQLRRDGNGDGLLEWGSDTELIPNSVPPWEEGAEGKTRAMWESGQDDLPNWDEADFDEETGTLTMNCVDLNSLYTLDAWCLAQMAKILDKREDQQRYTAEYELMKDLINAHLWDDKEGFYFDRHWDGRFSRRKAASNFYPLLARIPDEKRALSMIRHLLDPEEFWGDYLIPTVSRGDPAFKDQQYWRGTVWPPTNYLVYQGLKAYRLDVVASEFARKSLDLFLRSWENFQLCPENFDSRTGEPGGRRYQSWGPLFALIALEEYLDFTPWEGFRFGMLQTEEKGKLTRISIQGRHYMVKVTPSEVKLKEEGKAILRANGGAVFRHFLYSENEIYFEVKSLEKRKIKVKFLTKGRYQLRVDDQTKEVFEGKSRKFSIPEGEHTVMILLLEKLD